MVSRYAARQHAASAVNILTTAVAPSHGHGQLGAERIAKGISHIFNRIKGAH